LCGQRVNRRIHTYSATLIKHTHTHTHTQSLAYDSATSAEAEKFCAFSVRSNYVSFSLAEKFNLLHQELPHGCSECNFNQKVKEPEQETDNFPSNTTKISNTGS
jgi:hypothetical protein